MSLARLCVLIGLSLGLPAIGVSDAVALEKKCTQQGKVRKCVFIFSDLVEITTVSAGETAPVTGLTIVAEGTKDIDRMLAISIAPCPPSSPTPRNPNAVTRC